MKRQITTMFLLLAVLLNTVGCQAGDAESSPAPSLTGGAVTEDRQEKMTDREEKPDQTDREELVILTKDEVRLEKEVLQEINQKLSAYGFPYNIRFECFDEQGEKTSQEYMKWLQKRKKQGDGDLLYTGAGDVETEKSYDTAVAKGFLDCMDGYLKTRGGKKLKKAYPDKYWKGCSLDGKIYGFPTWHEATPGLLQIDGEQVDTSSLPDKITGDTVLSALEKAECKTAKPIFMSSENLLSTMGYVEQELPCICAVKRKGRYRMEYIYEDEKVLDCLQHIAGLTEKYEVHLDTDDDRHAACDVGMTEAWRGSDGRLLSDSSGEVRKMQTWYLGESQMISIRNLIWGVCSFSGKKKAAYQLLTLLQTEPELANLFVYGREGVEYDLVDGRVQMRDERGIGSDMPVNYMITYPCDAEPDDKEQALKKEIRRATLLPEDVCYPSTGKYSKRIEKLSRICDRYEGLWAGEYRDVTGTVKKMTGELEKEGLRRVLNAWNQELEGE